MCPHVQWYLRWSRWMWQIYLCLPNWLHSKCNVFSWYISCQETNQWTILCSCRRSDLEECIIATRRALEAMVTIALISATVVTTQHVIMWLAVTAQRLLASLAKSMYGCFLVLSGKFCPCQHEKSLKTRMGSYACIHARPGSSFSAHALNFRQACLLWLVWTIEKHPLHSGTRHRFFFFALTRQASQKRAQKWQFFTLHAFQLENFKCNPMVFLASTDAFFPCAIDEHDIMAVSQRSNARLWCKVSALGCGFPYA